ncbi:Peptidase inhibitor I78 family protein [Palleronia marisminoris]|uniref:Peptidase inhibitor I78 family protein n=1 Tax=Palleronia marisminoris TaxID=315423 RepID=A0A1Y5SKX9_9RHOB|nr:I78 family peptidase inhibitor [Palleronia marisminoris]SFG87709.1 Peptidase inhibitor I78 family protein [Palleronia marisminoris]SLN43195.1 Peptidase inhibitor I78 family protein [Palleronia marisminoris]
MHHSIVPVACLALALAACQTTPAPPAEASACEATAQRLQSTQLGTPVDAIDATGPAGRRVIGPDMAVTMDFVPGRLNLETDADGRLTRAYCG